MEKNIKFIYLYRDSCNYKNWGEVIFYNKNKITKDCIKKMISENLIDRMFFVASDLNVKDLHFPEIDISIDHDWHEFYDCNYTDESVNDIEKRDISEIINILKAIKYREMNNLDK